MEYARLLKQTVVLIFCVCTLLWTSASFTQANQTIAKPIAPNQPETILLNQLQQASGGSLRISYHTETGKVRFMGTTPEKFIAQPATLAENATPETAARGFLNAY